MVSDFRLVKMSPVCHAHDDARYELHVRTARFDSDILGLSGLVFDDGEIQLFCSDPYQRVRLPSPAKMILDDIYARRAAAHANDVAQSGPANALASPDAMRSA